MILVDKEIKQRADEIFQEGYCESNVTAISYDLHIQGIISGDELVKKYTLRPGEVVFIKTKEKIKMPLDLMGRIGEKNSRMRQGLVVAGPHYYPGHCTYLYLRVQNITGGTVKIKEGDKIAQIFFEQLTDKPGTDYAHQPNASFNDEEEYRGLARYKDEYEDRMEKLKNVNKDLDEKINNIYTNILTIMGLFVSVFSLVMVNFTNITENNMTKEFIVPMNISLGIVITLFVGLLLIFVNKAKSRGFLIAYIVLLLALFIGLFILL